MTSERLSVETTIARSPGAGDACRLRTTPDEEIALALRPNPRPVTTAGLHWIDPGFASLYLLANAANDLIRIGATDQIRKRFTAMNVASPVELRIVHFVHFVGPLVAKAVETDVHAKLLARRRRGEWFEVPVQEAAEIVAAAVEARFGFWTEVERRAIGATAARYHVRRIRRG